MREEAKGRSEEKNTARDVEEWKREGNEVPRGYWKKKRKGKKGNRMGIKQERKKRRQKREKVKKEVHTCYVDSWDIGVGKLSKCILTFIGEKSVTLKCNGCLYIIQATPKLACHLERETKETQSHCPLGPPHRSTLHNYYQLGVPLWSWLCSPLHAECSPMAAGCWGWRQCKELHSAGSSYGNSGHMYTINYFTIIHSLRFKTNLAPPPGLCNVCHMNFAQSFILKVTKMWMSENNPNMDWFQ